MANPREIEFSRKRYQLQDTVQKTFTDLAEEYHLILWQIGGRLDRLVGSHLQGHTIADQEAQFYMEVSNSESGFREKIYVTITAMDWNPVITIWGRNTEIVSPIVVTGEVSEALPEIREKIAGYLNKVFEA